MLKNQITYSNTFSIIFIIGFIFLLLNLGPSYLLFDKLQVVTIYTLNLISIFHYLNIEDKKKLLPLFQMLLIYFFFSCTLVFFFRDFEYDLFTSPLQKEILFENMQFKITEVDLKRPLLRDTRNILITGLLFLNVGYFFSLHFFKKKREGFNALYIKNENNFIFLGILVFIFFVLSFIIFKLDDYIPGFSQAKYPMIYSSMIMLFLGILISKNNIFINLLYAMPIFFMIYFHVTNGIYGLPFKLIIILVILFIFIKKRVPIIFSTVLLLLFLVLHSIKYDVRAVNRFEGPKFDRKIAFINILKKKLSSTGVQSFSTKLVKSDKLELRRTLERVVHNYQSLIIINDQHEFTNFDTPALYLNGSTYKILLSKLIPRIFWKNKPSDTSGNEMGRYYNMLIPSDLKTSWNFPVLNEFYGNFNLKGVIIGMFLLGAIFRYLSYNFFVSKIHNAEFIIAFSLILPLWYLESHLSLLIGALIQQYILLIFGFYLYSKFQIIYLKITSNEKSIC